MPRKALLLALAIISTACSKQNKSTQDISRFTPSGSLKPTVAIVPVIDNSHSGLSWNVSQEFTEEISNNIAKRNKFFVANQSSVNAVTHQLKESDNPFSNDYSWVKKNFKDNEFVVFLELVEHNEALLKKDHETGPADLQMAMRIRVFDVRGERPRVILQEIVQKSHYIPKFFTRTLAFQPDWQEEGYSISPMGMAHAEFSSYVSKRIQHYLGLHAD